MSDIVLSDGTILPKGQFVSFPAGPMTRDPQFYDTPDKFDGFRFYKEAKATNQGNSEFELAAIEPGNLHWGIGRLTCPGRWYASAVMKLILALVLREFDFKFPEGQTDRKLETYLDTMVQPNEEQKLLFRRRG